MERLPDVYGTKIGNFSEILSASESPGLAIHVVLIQDHAGGRHGVQEASKDI
jgi:hypothetical protein